jgi:hypothetical protein
MTTPCAQFPQIGNGITSEPDRVATSNDNELKKQLLSLLEEIRDEQQDYVDLKRERWGLADHSRMAEALVKRSARLWSGIDPDFRVWSPDDPIDGQEFLFSLLRPKHHVGLAEGALRKFMSTNPHHSKVLKDLINQLEGDDDMRFEWPEGTSEWIEGKHRPEWVPSRTCRCVEVTYVTPFPGPADRPLFIRHPP